MQTSGAGASKNGGPLGAGYAAESQTSTGAPAPWNQYPSMKGIIAALMAALTDVPEIQVGEYTGLGSGGAVTVGLDFDPSVVLIQNVTDKTTIAVAIKTPTSGLVCLDLGSGTAPVATAAANAATQSSSYVQSDVQTIATLVNDIKIKYNAFAAAYTAQTDLSSQITFAAAGGRAFTLVTTTAQLNVATKVYQFVAIGK